MTTLSKDVQDNITSDYKNGMSVRNIAKKYDLKVARVYSFLNNSGARSKFELDAITDDVIKSIIDLLNDGYSIDEVTPQFGIPRQYLSREFVKYGFAYLELNVDKDKRDELVTMAHNCCSANDIAKAFSLDSKAVKAGLDKYYKDYVKTLSESKYSEIKKECNERLNTGASLEDISTKCNIPLCIVRYISENIARETKKISGVEQSVIDAIIKSYDDCKSLKAITEESGLKREIVVMILKRNGRSDFNRKISDAVRQNIITLRTEGESIKAISNKCNISPATVAKIIKANSLV